MGLNNSYRGYTKAVFAGLEVAGWGWGLELRRRSRGGKARG